MKNNSQRTKTCQARRHFLRALGGAAVGTLLPGSCGSEDGSDNIAYDFVAKDAPRVRKPNPFVDLRGRPLLVCVTGTDLTSMLTAGLEAIGGLSKLIEPTEDVLIKPNCNAVGPYPSISSANCVVATMEEIQKISSGAISVGDQGAQPSKEVYPAIRLNPAVANNGGNLLTLGATYSVRRDEWAQDRRRLGVYREIYDASVIINSCVLKRHRVTRMSCALKNMFGTISGPNYTGSRKHLHEKSTNFMKDVAEVAGLVAPDLTIVDARTILTVSGPMAQDGVAVKADKMVISGDPVATDAYCATIMAGLDEFWPSSIDTTLNQAVALGLGTSDLDQVKIIEISV